VGEEYPGAELLRQVIEPSARIKDEHRVFGVVLRNEKRYKGIIVRREGETLHLSENLQEPGNAVAIPKADIVKMIPSDISPMPTGLLGTLTRDEVLDLLAYIASKGDRKHRAFAE
jgi:putative heme-binding domain-containing protein